MQTSTNDDASFFFAGDYQGKPNDELEKIVQREVWNDNLRFMKMLIERIARGEKVGYGPCHFAASLGSYDLMELLLNNGADKNERDRDGNPPLMWVIAHNGSEELLELLVDNGSHVNIMNFAGESPLFLAAAHGLADKVQYLLENGAEVTAVNLEGASPLHAAAANGDVGVIRLLVKYGAHVNAVDNEGDSPLHWAVREGQFKAATVLVQLGADITLADEDGESPLDLAICLDEKDIARSLVFASESRASKRGGEPFDLVVDGGAVMSGLEGLCVQEKRDTKKHEGVEASAASFVF